MIIGLMHYKNVKALPFNILLKGVTGSCKSLFGKCLWRLLKPQAPSHILPHIFFTGYSSSLQNPPMQPIKGSVKQKWKYKMESLIQDSWYYF